MNSLVIHPELITYAEAVGDRMAREYIERGDYFPSESWGCEGQIYPSLTGIALLQLFQVTQKDIYLEGVQSILESNVKKQMPSGGWSLSLGATANGIKFEASEHIKKITAEVEDLPPTVTALRLASEYERLTGDKRFHSSLRLGYEYLKTYWSEEKGTFDEMLVGDALKLRASPRDYHIYAFQCADSLQHIFPEAKHYVSPLYSSMKSTFEAMNADTYPLLYGMHAALITKEEGASEYVLEKVKILIEGELALKSRFIIPVEPGALGHRDGLRGVCLDEGHLRNSVGVALAMSFFDRYGRSSRFMQTTFYSDLKKWIQSMYDGGKYFEFMDLNSGEKRGFGSSGQYLPIFWILGTF